MSTGHTWLNLYPGKILGLQDLEDHLAATMREQTDQLRRDIYGAGGAIGARAVFTVAGDELTLTVDAEGYTPLGKRLILDASEPEYNDVPFEDAGATVYRVGVRHIDVPVEAQDGIDGLPHFSYHREAVGLIVNPVSVDPDVGGGLLLTMTGNLPQGMRWSVSAQTRPVIVWFETAGGDPVSKSTVVAIEAAVLVENAGVFTVTTANRFGQAILDATPARYRVAILGPTIYATGELPGEYATDFLDLGAVALGVFDNSTAPLVNDFAGTILAFNVQHDNATGVHLDVTADSALVGAPVGLPAATAGDLSAERVTTNLVLAEAAADSAVLAPVTVRQADGTSKVELRSGDPAAAGGGGELHFPNPTASADTVLRISTNLGGAVDLLLTNLSAADPLHLVIDGTIRKNPAKGVLPFKLEADDVLDEELQIENIGGGLLDVRMLRGSLFLDEGGISVLSGEVAASTFSGFAGLWSAGVDGVVDAAEFTGPLVTLTPGAAALAYAYNARVQFLVDYHPIAGGWQALGDPAVVRPGFSTGTSPPYVRPSALATNLTLRIPLTVPNWYRSSPAAPSDLIRIVQIDIRYRRVNAADTVVFRIIRVRKDGTLGEVIVNTVTAGVSGAADAVAGTGVINHTIDRGNFFYFLELTLQANAVNSDARIMNVLALFDKFGVE